MKEKSECKQCKKKYDRSEVRRANGQLSKTYILGFCSAACYTKSVLKQPNK